MQFKILIIIVTLIFSINLFGTYNQKEEFYKKFTPIKKEVLNENGYFSFSEVTEELRDLFFLAKKCGEESKELFDLYDIYSLVLSKKSEASDETIKITLELLEIFENSKLLDDKTRYRAHFRLSNAYVNKGEYNKAIEHKKAFLQLFKKDSSSTSDAILYQKERLAYLYHENGEYQKALRLNLIIEKKLGESADLHYFNLYNNIAQNYYELKAFKKAKAYLEKRLKVAKDSDDIEVRLDTLFQLAVLSFEEDDKNKAEKLFIERINLAKSNNLDEDIIAETQEDLDVFYEKLK